MPEMPPPAVMAAIRADARPVRPLRQPSLRALAALAAASLAAVALVAALDLRGDLAQVPPGAMALQFTLRLMAALALVWMALREASPSEAAPRWIAAPALALGLLLLVFLPWSFAHQVGARLALTPSHPVCFGLILAVALPSAAVVAWLLARAFPLRPVFAWATAGAGCGLFAESALFLVCPYSEPGHAWFVHGGAVLALTLLGAAAGALVARRMHG